MTYHLLTGATGLLGSYLLRDNLRAGHRVAVLVRPTRHESARGRIETILARWEKETGLVLPRPVVLEGDLSESDLDLDARSLQWIVDHCDSVIHSAASLTFRGVDPKGEPWRTNVEGTRRVLELCRLTGIRKFHHVSTAYVCGLREGRILESELDVGQEMGNDYEASKTAAEKMVRGAGFLDSPTIYRPAIIVGDSRTGYTTTFHGFYALLKLAHTLVSRVVLGATDGRPLIGMFGLHGSERKNFVPVDWVSAVISRIFSRPEFHGGTYHLTSRSPMTVAEMTAVIQDAIETWSQLADPSDAGRCDGTWFDRTFRQELEIYRAYWRGDPIFDHVNVTRAVPDLPCPVMDAEMLMRLARYAIKANFGRPRPRPLKPDFDTQCHLRHLLETRQRSARPLRNGNCLGLEVNGPGGGQFELIVEGNRIVAAEEGLTPHCSATFHLSSGTFQRLAGRQLTVTEALTSGSVVVDGNGWERRQLEAVLQSATMPDTPQGSKSESVVR